MGVRVLAPFGPRTLTGFIVHLGDRPPDEAGEVREIRALLDEEELMPPRMLEFTRLLSRRYASSWGEFLAAAVPPSYRPRARSRFRLTPEGGSAAGEGRLAGEEKRLAELLRGARYSARFLKKELGANIAPVLSRMRARGLVEEVEPGAPKRGKKKPASARVAQGQLALDFPPPAGLEKVFDEILHPAQQGSSGLFYFLGGRGSRESVYEALIRAVWKDSGRVLLLAPEISRAVDFLQKYEGLFAGSAAALHSRLTERQREEQWALIRSGRARLVAGTRSALFVPVPGLRVVVVEEEQDDSFFQAESPAYDTRQAARVLGRVMGAAVVFGSGHPSVESYHEAEAAGRVVRLRGETPPSKARLVDVRRERGFLSRDLTEAIGTHAARGGRMIVFLNRRGFASEVVCGRCGALPRCGRCDIPLFFLKRRNALVCRYCGMSRPEPGRCPVCGGPLRLGRSPGVEAVQEEIKRLFPRLRIAAFDSDSVRQESAQDLVLDRFERGRVNLLVGTQLLASRDRVPPASLVAVLNPESLLGIPDYRSGQRTYHSLCRMMRFAQGPG
ncbi:MAG: primosomal protein N', partial [Candidatus Aminicenantes bacterium]|nr:primosomal protein N' [Candidatus Aminicenantes bacterium]